MVPDLRIEEHGRIGERARGRTALVTMAVVLALAPLPVHGQEVESIEGGRLLGRCPPASGRVVCGHDLRIAPALDADALVLGGDRSRSSDRYRSRRDRSRSSDRYRSCRQRAHPPAHRGARSDRLRSRDLPLRAVTRSPAVSGHTDDYLPPLFVRDQGRKDGEPDVSSRRVWRR